MWKAAFTGRSEGGGSTAGRPSEPRRKKSHRAESEVSSRPRDEDDRRRSTRSARAYNDGGESVYGIPKSSGAVGYGSSPSHMAHTAPLTASALRMLPDDEEEWEDEDRDARSERKSRRSEGGEKRRKSGDKERAKDKGKERERERTKGSKDRSRSDSRERERKKSTSKSSGKEREKDKDRVKDSHRDRESQSERERDSKRRPQLVQSPERELSRAMPAMGSFEQFPGQYAGGHMGPLPQHQQDAIMSGALPNSAPQQGQFPGQDLYHEQSHDNNRPPLEHSSHSWGAAADYYLDTGESVQYQPGVRINSPNMLVNPDQHLVAASAVPIPAVDTGNGAANDFYSGKISPVHGVSASAPVTPASKPKPKPAKQSSWSALKPSKMSKPGKVSKPSKSSSSSAAAAALATAAGVGVLSGASHAHSSPSQQQTPSASKPNGHSSDGNVYYGPLPQSQAQPMIGGFATSSSPSYTYGIPGSTSVHASVNAYGAQSTNGGANYTNDYGIAHSNPGNQSTISNSNAPIYAAAGVAAAGLAAYGSSQHHQQSSHNMTSSSSYGNGGQGPPRPPRPGMGGFSHYPPSSGGGTGMHQMHHEHEHKGPMTRLKDGLFNLISTQEDTAKMEMYTEYIGVCKYCFDPRSSPWDAPRQHHYHRNHRRDSFDELRRRRSNERLGRKSSNDSLRRAGGVRIDKDNRYYASDSSRKRRESEKATGILGAGLAAAGVATAANAIFVDSRKDFDDTYSVKSGHRERSAARHRSRSSSREQRRRSTHGVLRSSDREDFVTVRRKDGTSERRRVRRQSRSSSREGRSNSFFAAAAGAALGAGAASAGMRQRSRSRSRDSKGRRSERRTPRSSYGQEEGPSSGGIFGFFSPPQKRRNSRKEHHKKRKGFFAFSNSSSSSSNSELAFGEGFSSKTSLPLHRKSSGRSSTKKTRRTSDDHLAATVAGIGATAAALAAAQRGGRINKRSSKVELGARKDLNKRGRTHSNGSPGSSDDEWEDELPFNVDDDSSLDGGLAFGDYGDRRVSSRQSLESIDSKASGGGLGAWGWRWGGKDKKRRSRNSTSPRYSYAPTMPDAFTGSANSGRYASGQASYLDDTGRRLPSMTATASPSVPPGPLQVVDPRPISDSGVSGSQHNSMPGAFGPESPPLYRPGSAPLQQPQPTTPIKPAFTHNPSALEDSNWSRSSPHISSSNNFAQDAVLIGAGALATAGIIAATSSNNSSGKRSKDSTGSNVRFGLTEDQQRKEDRERRKEEKQADEDRRRADRTRALKEEAERATRESESRRADAEAREAREEEIRRAREDENRRAAEARLAAARREAEEQAQTDAARRVEQQRSLREREETYRREQARLVDEARQQEERREADEREKFIRQQQEGDRRGKERKDAERKTSKSGRTRGQSVSEQSAQKESAAWKPIAGAAAATVGAVIAGRESRDRKDHDDPQSNSRQQDQQYQAKEVVPQTSHDGEPLLDDDIYDPDFFKRKHTPAQRARHEELARKAAEKVISDREHAYDDNSTYAEFFAPKDVLSEPAEGKTKAFGPNADNDIQVYHARDENILSHLDGASNGGSYGQGKHPPFGVPKLNLISPTPPITDQSPVRSKNSATSSPSSPLARAADSVEVVHADAETDSDGKSERLNRSISWGEDKTHIYEVRTPESYNEKERDSYITNSDMGAAAQNSAQQLREVVIEEASSSGKPKTTTYHEDELAKHYRVSAQRDSNNGVAQQPLHYRQPYADSVSDFSIQLPSQGTKGAHAIREYVEGKTNEPSPAEERRPRIPGGFDDDTDDIYTPAREGDENASAGASREMGPTEEPAGEESLSKKDKRRREKAAKAADPEAESEPQLPVEEPAAWEPPLSKKEQKKRDKAAKRSSTIESEPPTPTAVETEVAKDCGVVTESTFAEPPVEEPAWEPPLSKKEQKKRDKAKKQGLSDVVSALDNKSCEARESDPDMTGDLEASTSAGEVSALTKKEQRKQEKQARKSGFGAFADVADTILAAGGVAAAAAALNSTEDDEFSSAGKKKDKKGKKAKLGEPLDRDIGEAEPKSPKTEQSSMPGGWGVEQESPLQQAERVGAETAFDPFQYQVHDNDTAPPPTAPEPPAAQEVDPWAEFAEAKKSKRKGKRNSSAFNVPEVSSPLRTEVAWDDYVTGGKPATDTRDDGEDKTYTNGHNKDQDGGSSRSERTPHEPTSTSSGRRDIDYFDDTRQEVSGSSRRTSPDDLRSVASAPTPSRREESRRGGDYFEEPSYAHETQSVAASEPADAYASSKKSKRRSRHEDDEPRRSRRDDDDDTRSVTSSRSRRDKEESPSVKKDKKGGILGSLFGRKSESSRDAPRDSKSSKDDDDEDARRRRKKKHRESGLGDDDEETRSVKSESRHRSHRSRSEHDDDDDDARSMKSESRRKSSRSEAGTEDSRERRRRSVQESDYDRDASESGKRHHERRKSGEGSRSTSRHESRSESGHRHHRRRKTDDDTSDQSFLGRRVEDLPPLPADVPVVSSPATVAKSEQGVGTPVAAGPDLGTVNTNDDNDDDQSERTVEKVMKPTTIPASTETLSPRPVTAPRAASSTAIPLRFPFGHAPSTPPVGQTKERSMSLSSPVAPSIASSPTSPISARKSRQDRPRSTEIKPLYLVERTRKTPEVEDALPSLPSSGPSSRASSVQLSDAYESAVEELESPGSDRKRLQLDVGGAETWKEENSDVLGSRETTPKASDAQQFQPFVHARGESHVKPEPQFYTWEDFAREERGREVDADDLPPLPRSRSESPLKPDQHVGRDDVKVAAAAAFLGTAAVYAAGELRKSSSDDAANAARSGEGDLKSTDISDPAPDVVTEPDVKLGAVPLARISSTKKKGKKAKKLQWQDEEEEEEARATTSEIPAVDAVEQVAPEDVAKRTPPKTVYASSAAHTTPALNYRMELQGPPELAAGEAGSEDKADSGAAEPLTSDVPVSSAQPLQDQPQAVDAAPLQNFSLADFSNIPQGSAVGWHDSQAEAFESAMLGMSTNVPAGSDLAASRDVNPENVPNIADGDVSSGTRTAQADVPDEFTAVSLGKKQGKKDKKAKKQKASLWSEPDAEPGNVVPPVTMGEPSPARETVDEQTPDVEAETVAPSSSTQTSKRDKKKKNKKGLSAWDEPEATEVSGSVPEQAESLETADSRGLSLEDEPLPTPVMESQTPPASSSKKSKKDKKKKKLSAWDDPETKEDETLPEQTASVTETPQLEGDWNETPAIDEPAASSSSKKKAKKDKKKQSVAWDESEAPEETAPSPGRREGEFENDEAQPSANPPEGSSEDITPPSAPDSSSPLSIDPSANPTAVDNTSTAVPKKGKKGKKNRQSPAWSDTVAEPTPDIATPEGDDDAAFLDAEEGQGQPGSPPTLKEEHSTSEGALAGVVTAVAMAGLMNSDKHVPEPAAEDLASVSSKKSKKQKKKKQSAALNSAEAEASAETQDEFVDAEESLVVDGSHPVETEPVPDVTTRSIAAADDSSMSASREIDSITTLGGESTMTPSRKQSKKDKKKNKQPQALGPEPEPEPERIMHTRAGESEEPVAATAEGPDPESTPETSESADVRSETIPSPSLTRKQSKKDKKKNRQSSLWAAEQDPEPPEEPHTRSANEDAADGSAKSSADVPVEHNDSPQDIPLPPEAEDDFSEAAKFDNTDESAVKAPEDVPLPTEAYEDFSVSDAAADTQSASVADPQNVIADDVKTDPVEDVGSQQDERGVASEVDVPEADDFFGPADPLMEEPSRMTEDLDAFGEPTPLALEKEKKRAAREAAEHARLAESTREQPKDENYASMLTGRKPVAKKGSKKGRKSVSSATPPASSAPEQASAAESREDPQDLEEVAKADEAVPSAEQDDTAGPVTFDEPKSEPQDDDVWASSSKKKGKKGKKGRVSISETPMVTEEPQHAISDTALAEKSTGEEQILMMDAGGAQDDETSTQPADAQQGEDAWVRGSKKDKKSKKGKKSPFVADETAPAQHEPQASIDPDLASADEPGPRLESGPEPNLQPIQETPAPVAEPVEEELWDSGSKKKKGKKNKRGISMSEALPVPEELSADAPAQPPPVDAGQEGKDVAEESAPTGKEPPALDTVQPEADPMEESQDLSWSSSSKKKGKKSKKGRSSTVEVAAAEVNEPAEGGGLLEAGTPAAREFSGLEDVKPAQDVVDDIITGEDADTAKALLSTTDKGEEGTKSLSEAAPPAVESAPLETQATAMSRPASPTYGTEGQQTSRDSEEAEAEPVDGNAVEKADAEDADSWELPSSSANKKKKGKKGRKSEISTPPLDTTNDGVHFSAGEAAAEPEADVKQTDVGSQTPHDEEPGKKVDVELEPAGDAADSSWALPVKGKKAKKGKKSKQSWNDEEPLQETDRTSSTEAAEATRPAQPLPGYDDPAESARAATPSETIDDDHSRSHGIAAGTAAAAAVVAGAVALEALAAEPEEEWGSFSTKKSKKDKKKARQSGSLDAASTPEDRAPEKEDITSDSAERVLDTTALKPVSEATIVSKEPMGDDEWASSSVKKSGKDKKKSKQSGNSTPISTANDEPADALTTASAPPADDAEDVPLSETKEESAAAMPLLETKEESAAAIAKPVEDEWASLSTKKSKKDKKKAKQSGISTPIATPNDEPADTPADTLTTASVPPVDNAEDVPLSETKEESAAAAIAKPVEDEWASLSTKKSKKDKKKAKQSGTSTPIATPNDEPADAPADTLTTASAPPVDDTEDLPRSETKEEIAATIAEPIAEPEPVEDEWASLSTKKSKKDKKKAKQSGTSTPIATQGDDPVEPITSPPLPIADKQPEVEVESTAAGIEPLEDEWASLSTKKSKKDKKKAKKSGASTPPATVDDDAAVTVEAVVAAREVVMDNAPPKGQDPGPVVQTVEPEVDAFEGFSSAKKSKKDKKKAKKSGLSTPKTEPDEPSYTAGAVPNNMDTEQPRPAEDPVAVDADLPVTKSEDAGLEPGARQMDIDQGPLPESNPNEVLPVSASDCLPVPDELDQSGKDEDKEALPTCSSPAHDIDFAATLAAGLADSGFNPDIVINDPIFHRRASPPVNSPEADPEETSFTTTGKRRKGKKGKSLDDGSPPPVDPMGSGQPITEDLVPPDDFIDTVGQGLKGTGFDPALLKKALASGDNARADELKEDQPDFSFVTTKRKKGKKGKLASIGADDFVSDAITTIPSPEEITKMDKPEATENVGVMPAEDTVEPAKPGEATALLAEQDDSNSNFVDPASRLTMGGEGEMDVEEMDKAYKAYKKNKRKQRKTKASAKADGSSDNPESSMDTEKSAAASENEERTLRNASTLPGVEKSGPEGFLHTSEISQSLPIAASVAEVAAKSAQVSAPSDPDWSFASLQEDTNRNMPEYQHENKEHQVIRDSGYEEASRSVQHSERSSREIPNIVQTSSSRESLRNRRSLEPLRISTGSTPDEEPSAKALENRSEASTDQALHAQARTPIADTPLLPTTSAGSSSQPQLYDPQTPGHTLDFSMRSANPDDRTARTSQHGFSTAASEATHDRPPLSPISAGPPSPRTPLRPIAEESHSGKRSKATSDVGGPEQTKLSKRSQTPQDIQGTRIRHRTLSPETRVPPVVPTAGFSRAASNPLSTDDIIKRLSWPAVDEENDTVNIDRSVSRKPIMPDMRSPSVMSNRSATSGTYGRSAQELRSYSRNSNQSNHSHSSTPSLRRINLSGDLRAASRRGETGSSVSGSAPNTIPFEAPPTPPLNDDELNPGSASRAADMSDVFQGYGDAAESHVSPTRPPSVRKRQSMHINELESRLDSLVAENRALQEARQSQDASRYVVNDQNLVETLQQRELDLQAKDAEINQIKAMLQPMQEEIARLTEMNNGLIEANRNLVDDTNGRYATLQAEHAQAHEQWQTTTRNLESMQQEHGRITSGMKDILEAEIAAALADKNSEILRLREQLDIATEQIRALQVQIQSSNSSDFLVQRDEDYFDGSCQKLCQHVQQWVLRFSKLSDNRVCRLSTELNDDKLEARLDNAVLDGSDVDKLLGDRIRRRDVFMSVVMTMVWEYIFTRYLFGMDREQRQKLKALEKLLSDVGPPRAVAHWRATTLTLLSKRPNFASQCAMDTEAVAIEIFGVLCSLLPPPSASEQQLLASLQKVIGIAVDLSIEMRSQRAEYIMLPPLQPEYDTNGDLVRKVHFNASLMNERSGFFSSNEELAAEHAVVKIVLFPLVVKKGDDVGEGEEEIVVCPAQVLVRNDAGKGKKVVRVMSGAMEIDDPIRSRSRLSSKPSMMSEGGAF